MKRLLLVAALAFLPLGCGHWFDQNTDDDSAPHCSKGCPCGRSCISCSKTCHK